MLPLSVLAIEMWPITRPVPYGRNARKIPQDAIDKVAGSLKEFGWRQPIVVDREGVIVVGHTRLLAAQQLGMAEVPVHVASNLTPEQVRAYRLADNRTHDETGWDLSLLAVEMKDLASMGVDLSATAFDGIEIDRILRSHTSAEEEANAPISLPATAISRPGDLWLLGPHRVLCGDSTDTETVKRLLGKERPRLMVTDPPYGVEYDAAWRVDSAASESSIAGLNKLGRNQIGQVSNDDRVDWSAAFRLFPGDVAYVWHASLKSIEAGQSLNAAGFIIRSMIIWAKQHLVIGRGHYHWQHEPCFYAVKKGRQASWRGDRKQSTIWNVQNLNPMGGSKETKTGHSTQKPIEIMRRPMLNHTERGDQVYDPFLGSGSTLIAAEQEARVCFGLDIDPRYIDVIVKRWQDSTGAIATTEDGKTLAQLTTERGLA